MRPYLKYLAVISLEVAAFYFLKQHAYFINHVYISSWFPHIGLFLRYFSSFSSLSIGLLIWYLLGIMLLGGNVFLLFKKRFKGLFQLFLNVFVFAYPLFMLLWGLAYGQTNLKTKLQLDTQQTSKVELDALCKNLVESCNKLRPSIGNSVVLDSILRNYNLKTRYTARIKSPLVKEAIFSNLMSYMNTAGVYNFMSSEANINKNLFFYEVPFVASHELAHQAGIAAEQDANFVAYQVCSQSSDCATVYSAHFELLRMTLNRINGVDSTLAKSYYNVLSDTIKLDLKKLRNRAIRFKNPVDTYVIGPFYDLFLKSNGQSEGSLSYDNLVDMVIADRRKSIF